MKSGYSGRDAMREKAERAFGSEMCHGRVKRNMGGMMGGPENTADSIQQANQILSNAASNGVGLKRGGKAMHGMRHKRADGGPIDAMGTRDFMAGKSAMGLKRGGSAKKDHSNRPVRKSFGGFMRGVGNVLNDRPFSAQPQRNGAVPVMSNAAQQNYKAPFGPSTMQNYLAATKAPTAAQMPDPTGAAVMKRGGRMCKREMGGEVKKAIGGVGKIRHGQMTRGGAQIAPRGRHKG